MNNRSFVLNRFSRTVIGTSSLASFLVAIALTPSEVRSRIAPLATPAFIASESTPGAVLAVAPNHDPFEPRARDQAPVPARELAPAHVDRLPALPSLATIGPLPPNAGARLLGDPGPVQRDLLANEEPRVTAIVTGPHPAAIVEVGGRVRFLSTGDRLNGSTIAGIDAAGVRLTGGGTVRIAPARTNNR